MSSDLGVPHGAHGGAKPAGSRGAGAVQVAGGAGAEGTSEKEHQELQAACVESREGVRETLDGLRKTLDRISETEARVKEITACTSSFDKQWEDFKARFDQVFEMGAKALAERLQAGPLCCQMPQHMRPAEAVDPLRVAQALRRASKVVVLTGAGVSAESGIPTFRGADGYWTVGSKNYRPQELATWEKFDEMPEELWRWYQYRWGVCRAASPNAGHRALVDLEGLVDMTLVTQNIDGLHLQAGSDPKRTCEIHGRIDEMRCDERVSGSCLHGLDLNEPANAERAQSTVVKTPAPAASEKDETLHTCARCGVRQRPKILWFDECYNEALYRSKTAVKAVEDCDVLVVAGTQLTTGLPQRMVGTARSSGALIVCIDPLVELTDEAFAGMLHLRDKSGIALPRIVEELRALKSEPLPAPLADIQLPRRSPTVAAPPPCRSNTPARTIAKVESSSTNTISLRPRGETVAASKAASADARRHQRAASLPSVAKSAPGSKGRSSLRAAALTSLAPTSKATATKAPVKQQLSSADGFFVYGTLRPDDDSGATWTAEFCSGLRAEAASLVGGSLYIDGTYPAVCLERTRCTVRGVFLSPQEGSDFHSVMCMKLAEADRIEGYPELYHRDVVPVSVTAEGQQRIAMAHLYHRTGRIVREQCVCIADGDWLSRKRADS